MWKTFTVLYGKFTQDNVYQIYQNQAIGFCGRYDKTFWDIFSVHSVCSIGVKVDDDLSLSFPFTPLPSLLVHCDICSENIGS